MKVGTWAKASVSGCAELLPGDHPITNLDKRRVGHDVDVLREQAIVLQNYDLSSEVEEENRSMVPFKDKAIRNEHNSTASFEG